MSLRVTGGDKIRARLKDIAARVAETIVADAATAAADPLIDAMKANLSDNVFLDRLRPGIGKDAPAREGGEIVVRVGPTVRGFTGRFMEFGTPHQAAEPWARPAADTSRGQVLSVFGAVVGAEVKKVAEALS